MKVTLEFQNPVNGKEKIKKTFTLLGKKKEKYTKELLEMAQNGMMIIPIDLHVVFGDTEYSQQIMVSTPAIEKGYRGHINQRPKEEVPKVEVVENKPEPRVWGKSKKKGFWKRFFSGFDSNDIGRGIWKV